MIENIQEIKNNTNIQELLRKIGYPKNSPLEGDIEIRDFCPIHGGDNGRNLCINKLTKMAKCHSCGFEGDVIKLYSESTKTDFNTAVRAIAETSATEIRYKPATKIVEPIKAKTPQQWIDNAQILQSHPYLDKKCVEVCDGLYRGYDQAGNDALIVPFYDVDHNLVTIQTITTDGGKFFLKGYGTKSVFFTIGQFKDGDTVWLAEGLATALTIWMAFGKSVPVISFGSAGNLTHVVSALKQKYTSLNIVICLDNNKAALTQAQKVASDYSCSYRMPHFDGMIDTMGDKDLADFNDLISKCGQQLSAVKDQLARALNFDDIQSLLLQPMQEPAQQEVAPHEELPLQDDIELDILHWMAHRSFDSLVDDGFNPDDFDPALFTGKPIKEGRQLVSLNRVIVETIKETWQKDEPVLRTNIPLRAGTHAEQVQKILNEISTRPIPSNAQVKTRLEQLRKYDTKTSLCTELENINKRGNVTAEDLERIKNITERGQIKNFAICSDDFCINSVFEEEELRKDAHIATEFVDFNLLLDGGFRGGTLITLQGKAGAGKSTFMMQMKDYLASQGVKVIFVAMEQTLRELISISLIRIKAGLHKNRSEQMARMAIAELSRNIFTVEGHKHISSYGPNLKSLTISTIGNYVRHVINATDQKPVLFIDPFQRLMTGYKDTDAAEYEKINLLIKLIKAMALSLDITIIIGSDTTKDHMANSSGEGAGRGSYMIQHESDIIMTFKESETSPFEAIYQFIPAEDTGSSTTAQSSRGGQKRVQTNDNLTHNQRKILEATKDSDFEYSLNYTQEDIWVSTVVSKNRNGRKFSPLFIHERKNRRFKEVPIWKSIISKDQE